MRVSAYKCTHCGNVKHGEPSICECGASPAFQFPHTVTSDGDKPKGGQTLVLGDFTFMSCYRCPYHDFTAKYPGSSCLALEPQHVFWTAANNLIIRPARKCRDETIYGLDVGDGVGSKVRVLSNTRTLSHG